jgi:glycosyltransferase involved in cell wall biosynthesis
MTSPSAAVHAAVASSRPGARPPVVCHVITSLATAGAQKMLLKLVTRLDRDRFASVVVTLVDGPVADELRAADVPVFALAPRKRLPSPAALVALRRWLRRHDPTLIHGWLYHGNLGGHLCAALAPRRVPVIWSIHTTLAAPQTEKWRTTILMRLGALCSGLPARIVYVSRTSQRHHEAQAYRARHSCVIPIGIDCSVFAPDPHARRSVREELGLSAEAVLVGCVARYHPVKNHRGVLEAAAIVAEAMPALHVVLVGEGIEASNAELRALVEGLGLGGRVHLLGPRRDVARLTAALDVAVLGSLAESWPNVVGEAMACGVPCVVSDVGDTASIVGDSGAVVPPGDVPRFAQALLALLRESAAERRRLGVVARARVAEHFTLDAVTELYGRLYAHVVEEHRT